MKKRNKQILYTALLVLGLLIFILEIFIFQKPDGVLGFIICLMSIYLIIASVIKLCKLSEMFTNNLFSLLDLLFWLP